MDSHDIRLCAIKQTHANSAPNDNKSSEVESRYTHTHTPIHMYILKYFNFVDLQRFSSSHFMSVHLPHFPVMLRTMPQALHFAPTSAKSMLCCVICFHLPFINCTTPFTFYFSSFLFCTSLFAVCISSFATSRPFVLPFSAFTFWPLLCWRFSSQLFLVYLRCARRVHAQMGNNDNNDNKSNNNNMKSNNKVKHRNSNSAK